MHVLSDADQECRRTHDRLRALHCLRKPVEDVRDGGRCTVCVINEQNQHCGSQTAPALCACAVSCFYTAVHRRPSESPITDKRWTGEK